MIHQVATRLKDLHAAGFVHRDLKPANIMWLPRENRWTIIDFGCVARVGEVASTGFSIGYAAPEVIRAYRNKENWLAVSEALDAWSLGVISYELMTGEKGVDMRRGADPVSHPIPSQQVNVE
ncbi:MAG: protein kinase [Akkermansiaceae bacterium]|nr:protein kinase [Akkermansiaceae bacterium]